MTKMKNFLCLAMIMSIMMGSSVVVFAMEPSETENVEEELNIMNLVTVTADTIICSSPYYPNYGVQTGYLRSGDWVVTTDDFEVVNGVQWVRITNSSNAGHIGWVKTNCLEGF